MKHTFTLLIVVTSLLLISCDKYEKPIPDPVEISFLKPGIIEFRLIQSTSGRKPDLQTDSMQLQLINQSNKQLSAVQYSIRGFGNDIKDYRSFNYWQEEIFVKVIQPYENNVFTKLSNSFHDNINLNNIEIDLISYKSANEDKQHKYSGSFKGTFTVIKDSSFFSYGEHYSWIDYKGFFTCYYDSKNSPWKSLKGQIVSDSILYGEIILNDTIISITSSVTDTLNQIHINYDFAIHSSQNYQLSMILNKN